MKLVRRNYNLRSITHHAPKNATLEVWNMSNKKSTLKGKWYSALGKSILEFHGNNNLIINTYGCNNWMIDGDKLKLTFNNKDHNYTWEISKGFNFFMNHKYYSHMLMLSDGIKNYYYYAKKKRMSNRNAKTNMVCYGPESDSSINFN